MKASTVQFNLFIFVKSDIFFDYPIDIVLSAKKGIYPPKISATVQILESLYHIFDIQSVDAGWYLEISDSCTSHIKWIHF